MALKKILLCALAASVAALTACNTQVKEQANSTANLSSAKTDTKIRALIIEGQNNHVMWPKTSRMMAKMLKDTNRFEVDIATTQHTFKLGDYAEQIDPNNVLNFIDNNTKDLKNNKTDANFSPNFSDYDVVVSNFGYGAAPLSLGAQAKLEQFVANGGGFVSVHAANNAWPDWEEYNLMTGFGGWGGRNEKSGPYVYLSDTGGLILDHSVGESGSHGKRIEFLIETREPNHPIMQGVPAAWLHTVDELYGKMRGPAKNMTVLASAYDEQITQKHEPVMAVIKYKKGHIFHTTLGHDDVAMACVGFISMLQRGTQWAATQQVDIPIPDNFPTKTTTSSMLPAFENVVSEHHY